MTVLRELIAVFGVDFDSSEVDKGKISLGGLSMSANEALGFITNLAGEIASFVNETTAMARSVDRASQAIGVSAEAYQVLGLAAESVGLDVNGLGEAMGGLAARVAAAGQSSQARKVFDDMGVAIRGANGELRTLDQIFIDTAEGIQNTSNPTERLSMALQVFGDKGRALMPVLAQGREGLEAFRAQLEELGGGVGQDAIEATRRLTVEEGKFSTAMTSLRSRLLVGVLPVFTKVIEYSEKIAGYFARITRGSRLAEVAMGALGIAVGILGIQMLVAFAPVIAPILLAGAAIAVVALAVDDLIVMFEGGNSVMGEFIDSLFGVGTAASGVDTLTDAWENLQDGMSEVIATWRDLLGMDPAEGPGMNARSERRAQRTADAYEEASGSNRDGINRMPQETQRAYLERLRGIRAAQTPATTPSSRVAAPAGVQAPSSVSAPRNATTRSTTINRRDNFVINGTAGMSEADIRRQITRALDERDRDTMAALDQTDEDGA